MKTLLKPLNERQRRLCKHSLISQAKESYEKENRRLERQNQIELGKQKALKDDIQAGNVAEVRGLAYI